MAEGFLGFVNGLIDNLWGMLKTLYENFGLVLLLLVAVLVVLVIIALIIVAVAALIGITLSLVAVMKFLLIAIAIAIVLEIVAIVTLVMIIIRVFNDDTLSIYEMWYAIGDAFADVLLSATEIFLILKVASRLAKLVKLANGVGKLAILIKRCGSVAKFMKMITEVKSITKLFQVVTKLDDVGKVVSSLGKVDDFIRAVNAFDDLPKVIGKFNGAAKFGETVKALGGMDEFIKATKKLGGVDNLIEGMAKFKNTDDFLKALKSCDNYDDLLKQADEMAKAGDEGAKSVDESGKALDDAAKKGEAVDGDPFNRTQEELDSLASDPAHGNKIDIKSMREREVGLALEKSGKVPGPITRDPSGAAEFIDNTGQLWDVKGFNSNFPPKKGGYTLQKSMNSIMESLSHGENVMLDTKNLSTEHLAELLAEIKKLGLDSKVIPWPL
ncbi:MAG: hypothetical protein JXR70_04970 [Spirochaetales bacterium]|nr:hypothetical protein [Spirochaetales bacterium]